MQRIWNRNKIKGEDKMTKYRKKPIVVEAVQFLATREIVKKGLPKLLENLGRDL